MQDLIHKIAQNGLAAAALRLIKLLKTIIVAGLIIVVTLNCFNVITAIDFPWQLTGGQFILNHGYPAKSVFHAYGEISPHFSDEYILYEIVIAAISRFAGWIGLCLFFGIITFIIYTPCLSALFKLRGHFSLITVFLFMIAQELIDWRLYARPELVADACYIAVGISLLRHKEHSWNRLQLFCFGLIFCIWSNVHDTFLIGLAMVGLWYIQMFLFDWKTLLFSKGIKWIRPGMTALIGCMVNPFGFYRLIQPFELHGLLWGQGTSPEMWPIMFDKIWIPLAGTIVGIITLTIPIHKQKNYWIMLLLFIFQYLSIFSFRYTVFIGLTLLIIVWDELKERADLYQPKTSSRLFALGECCFCLVLTVVFLDLIAFLVASKIADVKREGRFLYPNTLVAINSSFAWLNLQPRPNYALLSRFTEGSFAQMPGCNGIHPLIDSGTHRYSDRVNELYYYALFDPDTLGLVSSNLNVDAIILDEHTFSWAPVLNASPEWNLAQIGPDSQLYLRNNHPDIPAQRRMFMQWAQNAKRDPLDPGFTATASLLRGLKLRPDKESLRMLVSIQEISWTFDPQITYLKNWIGQVPDDLLENALKQVDDKSDNSSTGIRILLLLRLRQYELAMEIAKKWKPFWLDRGYQECRELQAEAFISGGDDEAARKILESLWPQPRYSLRWAKLCEQAYVGQKKDEPENARLLTDLEERSAWKNDLITLLNQNILRLTTQ